MKALETFVYAIRRPKLILFKFSYVMFHSRVIEVFTRAVSPLWKLIRLWRALIHTLKRSGLN